MGLERRPGLDHAAHLPSEAEMKELWLELLTQLQGGNVLTFRLSRAETARRRWETRAKAMMRRLTLPAAAIRANPA